MNGMPTKKLTLKKDVLRKLNEADLSQVVGGKPVTSASCEMCSSVRSTCPSSAGATDISCCVQE